MPHTVFNIPALLRTPFGRQHLRQTAMFRAYPLYRRAAGLYRRKVTGDTRITAVVGSFGKSVTTLAAMTALGLERTPDFELNGFSHVARALLRVPRRASHAVIEVGIDGPWQMARHSEMLRPDTVIFTSVGSEHHRSLGDLKTISEEKALMLRGLSPQGTALLNGDDPHVTAAAGHTPCRVITFGFGPQNDVRATDVEMLWPEGCRFNLHLGKRTKELTVKLYGRHQLYAVLAAAALAVEAEGFDLDVVLERIAAMPPLAGRLQPVHLDSGAILLRDEFKSSLETVHAALDLMSRIPAKRRILVQGEISEPPGSQGPIYREVGRRIASAADRAVLIGGNFQRYAAGAKRAGMSPEALFDARRDIGLAVRMASDGLGPGDVVLVKGRDTQRLDRVSLALMGRKVRCRLPFCRSVSLRCETCPMLGRDFHDHLKRPSK